MIAVALKLKEPLRMLISMDRDLQPFELSDDEWDLLDEMKALLGVSYLAISSNINCN